LNEGAQCGTSSLGLDVADTADSRCQLAVMSRVIFSLMIYMSRACVGLTLHTRRSHHHPGCFYEGTTPVLEDGCRRNVCRRNGHFRLRHRLCPCYFV